MHTLILRRRKAKRVRERFLREIYENIVLPYELSEGYEEEVVGGFENKLEEEYFHNFISLLKPKAKILDLACGDGRHTLKLSDSVEYVVAFDISSKNLKKAKRKCAEENVSYMKGSMLKLPFRRQTFDGVWFSQAFEYVPPDLRETFLQQLNLALKTNGILFMSVETWMDTNIFASISGLLSDFKLFCYWKFLKRKPLIWGEFLYYCTPRGTGERFSGWHYHVHTDKCTLRKLLDKCGFIAKKMDIKCGYIYLLAVKS
ncbi:MAG: class I SAM-dependent methyltransferase [Candidatus Bathyarchaeia archaeon]